MENGLKDMSCINSEGIVVVAVMSLFEGACLTLVLAVVGSEDILLNSSGSLCSATRSCARR